jgi:hypothetical protein
MLIEQEKNNKNIIQMIENNYLFHHKKFKRLIFNCNINIQDKNGKTPLMYLLEFHNSKKIELSEKKMFKLLKKCNLNIEDKYGQNIFVYLLLCQGEEKIFLNEKKIRKIFLSYSYKKQQQIFLKVLEEKRYFHSYEKDFYFFINTCNLLIPEKTMQWLHQKKHFEALDIIKINNIKSFQKKLQENLDYKTKIEFIKL